jgi:hypothetical protein
MSNNKRDLPPVQRKTIDEATAEAESRALEYNPNERAAYVRTMLRDIALWMSQGDSEETITNRIPEFVDNYPELFKKMMNREDISLIQSMLAMLDKMGQGTLSQHQASIIIGKKLVDRYITPQLNGDGAHK